MGKCLIETFISVFIEPWILLSVLVVYFLHPHSFMLMWLLSLMRASTACGRQSDSHTAALKTRPVADVWQNWHLLWMPECHVLRKMPGTSFGMCNVTSRRQGETVPAILMDNIFTRKWKSDQFKISMKRGKST